MEKRKENARYLNQCFTMMVLLNCIIVLFLAFTIVLTQYRVAAAQEAQQFIETLKVMPERPEQKIIMVVFSLCFLCGIIYYKRRNEEEISKLCKYDGEKLITKILPIVDNFERAISLDDRDLSDEVSKFLSGFKMIYTNLVSILEDFEVKEIDCKGLEFDPNKMEAVLTDSDKNLPSNVVIEVLQKGYTYKDKVIRVAMVKVNE